MSHKLELVEYFMQTTLPPNICPRILRVVVCGKLNAPLPLPQFVLGCLASYSKVGLRAMRGHHAE